jgi:hypothetical protein
MLEYRIKEGWGPLFAFLGWSVPEGMDYPRRDD